MKLLRNSLCALLLMLPFYQANSLTLNIGALTYNPPFEVMTNEPTVSFFGFEISILQEICRRINANCQFQGMLFQDIPQNLNTGKIDLGIGSIVITPRRSQHFLFTMPIKESYLQFLVQTSATFSSVKDLAGKKIGFYSSSPSKKFAMMQFNKNIQMIPFTNSLDMLNALEKKVVDALLTNDSQAAYWIANNGKTLRTLGKKYKIGDGYGIMAKLGQTELILKINKALLAMEKDGTYLAIYNKSF